VDRLTLEQENWLTDIAEGTEISAQVRYRSAAHPCRFVRIDGAATLELAQPISAPAPGQSIVLYGDARVLGGGVLSRSSRSY
jgi:tRNA U34 2-thiouridine synthase MnmA/TrmU